MDTTTLIICAVLVVVIVVVVIVAVVARKKSKRSAVPEEEQEQVAEEVLEEEPDEEPREEEPPTPDDIDDLIEEPRTGEKTKPAYNSETVYTSIDVTRPCGFDFSNVVEGYRTKSVKSQGDVHSVYASGSNFEKIKSDVDSLRPLLDSLSGEEAKRKYRVSFPDCSKLVLALRPFGEKDSLMRGMKDLAVISVIADAGPKVDHPVTVRAVTVRRGILEPTENGGVVRAQDDSLVVDLRYADDGSVEDGRIVRWSGRSGYLCEFRWSDMFKGFRAATVKVASTPGNWKTTYSA
ncbi:MAG: hypothetical protein ACOYIK_06025 [Coriobacteriales bacterium]